MPTEAELHKGFKIGDWEILPARGVFRREDQEESPEPLVFGVLLALAKRDGDLVTRDELIDELHVDLHQHAPRPRRGVPSDRMA